MSSVYNFYAGPAVIFDEVLRRAEEEFFDFAGTGMSVLEISHRAKAFDRVMIEAETNMKELMGLGDDYRVLFLQGGASTQFSMIPMNFLKNGRADYILTGSWSKKAFAEAKKIGDTSVAFDGGDENFSRIPKQEELMFSDDPVYVHMTTNNTIFGTEFNYIPDTPAPLVADMSSDILSKPLDFQRFALIYAGAQKNLGPAGVTAVVIRRSFLETADQNVPATMLKYATHAEKNSLYNTPPVFSVYLLNLVLRHLKDLGGLPAIAEVNQRKAGYIYDAIDGSGGFYRGHAQKDSRSLMNITFTMANEESEKKFVAEGEQEGFIGLKGHRSVGGLRASVYNAMPEEGAKALADFMKEFMRKNG